MENWVTCLIIVWFALSGPNQHTITHQENGHTKTIIKADTKPFLLVAHSYLHIIAKRSVWTYCDLLTVMCTFELGI